MLGDATEEPAPNPANKDGHVPTLLIGNESTGQWMRASALDNPKMTATMISSWVGGYPKATAVKSYADASGDAASVREQVKSALQGL